MSISKRGGYYYGTTIVDVETEIRRYTKSGYQAVRFALAKCTCGGDRFHLRTDENEGVGQRVCTACDTATYIGDSGEYADGAELRAHDCLCGESTFNITVGVALYEDSNDVRWTYIGCRCPTCSVIGVFADWKSEAGDADDFLARV